MAAVTSYDFKCHPHQLAAARQRPRRGSLSKSNKTAINWYSYIKTAAHEARQQISGRKTPDGLPAQERCQAISAVSNVLLNLNV